MIWKVDTQWLVMAGIVVAMLSYILGYFVDKIMGRQGFNPAGNMVLIWIGFFGGIYLANLYGFRFHNLHKATTVGLLSAFSVFIFAAVGKGLLYRTSS